MTNVIEMSWLCELKYHVKDIMIQGWIWMTFVPYYVMTMMCWSNKWRVLMKRSSHAISNKLLSMNLPGVSLLWTILRYDYEEKHKYISKRHLA